jgi:hypothetical protein
MKSEETADPADASTRYSADVADPVITEGTSQARESEDAAQDLSANVGAGGIAGGAARACAGDVEPSSACRWP